MRVELSFFAATAAIWLGACTSSSPPPRPGAIDGGGAVDGAVGAGADAASQPLAGCEDFIACCTAPGVSGAGVFDDECGSNGLPCEDCAARGERCRTTGDGTYFCTPVLADGQVCSAGWQCLGETCGDDGTCDTTCVGFNDACQADIGRTTCCEPAAQCTNLDEIGANQRCCYPPGTIVASTDECVHCCDVLASCDFVSPGRYQCNTR